MRNLRQNGAAGMASHDSGISRRNRRTVQYDLPLQAMSRRCDGLSATVVSRCVYLGISAGKMIARRGRSGAICSGCCYPAGRSSGRAAPSAPAAPISGAVSAAVSGADHLRGISPAAHSADFRGGEINHASRMCLRRILSGISGVLRALWYQIPYPRQNAGNRTGNTLKRNALFCSRSACRICGRRKPLSANCRLTAARVCGIWYLDTGGSAGRYRRKKPPGAYALGG